METNNIINLSKYVGFDKTTGKFCLINDGDEILYHQKESICSYSGANQWCHHFVCELLDVCSGSSPYNFSLFSFSHEDKLNKYFKKNSQNLAYTIENCISEKKKWFTKALESFDLIIEMIPSESERG